MGVPAVPELIIIAVAVIVLFGGKQLPKLGGAVGDSIRNFKKALKDDEEPKRLDDEKKP